MAKNLTLAVDEEVLDKIRVVAAVRRTTVSEMVRGFFERTILEARERDEAREELLALIDGSEARLGDWRPSRAETYTGSARFD
ncbi:MAG: DUF6364 family protein [Pseudomonadota bacterium]